MNVSDIVRFLLTVLVAGVLGGGVMELVMWAIGRAGWVRADMIVALGSLFTRSRVNAFRVGVVLHVGSAVVFSALYAVLMMTLHATALPMSLGLGLGLGFVHGLVASLMLLWVISERHPLPEFQETDLAIGLSHLIGHVAFGIVVGLVIGLAGL